jgi:hypothetical protein
MAQGLAGESYQSTVTYFILTGGLRSEKMAISARLGESTILRGEIMTKASAVAVLSVCLSFVAGVAVADRVHDWHDLEAVHDHVQESIHEMETARAANHYDMAGHGAKAEDDLRRAEHELRDAIDAARMGR